MNDRPLCSPQILEIQHQHPDIELDILIKIPLSHRVLTHNVKGGHHRMTPTDQWKTICEVKQMVQTTEHRVHKHLPQTLMVIICFRIREVYPVHLVPHFQVADIHSHPTRDRVKRHPNKIIHSLPFQIYLHEPVHIPRAET